MTSNSGAVGYDWAKPGVKVVCIDGIPKGGFWCKGEEPQEGSIYTIRKVLFCKATESVVLHFLEIRRSEEAIKDWGDSNLGYGIFRFRPLVTKQLPQSLTCLLKNPKSVILPNEGQKFDTREKVQ